MLKKEMGLEEETIKSENVMDNYKETKNLVGNILWQLQDFNDLKEKSKK